MIKAKEGGGLISGKKTVTTSRGGECRGPIFRRLPSMLGKSNFAFVVSPGRHEHLRSLGYTFTTPTSVLRERFPLSLEDFEGLQVISQATPPRLLWPPPSMPITTIDNVTLQQGSWEVVELLLEQEIREQESALSNGRLHALTSGHGQSRRVQ